MKYDARNPKIEFYLDGKYVGTTQWFRLVRDAQKYYGERYGKFGKVTTRKAKR